jgi:cell division protein FtsB
MSDPLELDPLLVEQLKRPEPQTRRRVVVAGPALQVRPAIRTLAFYTVCLALLVAFSGRILGFLSEPVLATMRVGADIRGLEVQLDQERKVNTGLEADIHYLRTKAGVEQEARHRGWVRPGEVALSVEVPDDAPTADVTEVMAEEPETEPAIADRIRDALETMLAVFGGSKKRGG